MSEGVTMPHITKIAGDHGKAPYLSFFCIFSLFLLFLNTPAIGGTIELPQTGQTTCYDAAGNPIACGNTGQDGDYLAGVIWPGDRFSIYKTDCIVDNLTGLMWSRNAWNLTSPTSWSVSVLNPPTAFFACGFSDWRLPNINELQSLVNFEKSNNVDWLISQGFFFLNVLPIRYWSSTSAADAPESNAWFINMVDGFIAEDSKLATYFIWPVRGTSNPAEDPPVGQIAETGQIAIKASYDDAYYATTPGLNVGVPLPDPRYTLTYCDATGPCTDQDTDCDADTSNNIVMDNLPSLVWSGDANLDGLKNWANALSFANGLTTCGYGDWRLPNSKELFSLVDRSQSVPALPAGYPFANVQPGADNRYWSSTSYASDPGMAWALGMLNGSLNPWTKTDTAFVWPIRGGHTKPYVLTVKKEGTGKGKITATDLSCSGNTCTGYYSSYEEVIVTATPSAGSVFLEWTNCPEPSGNTCTITITDDTTIKATFLPEYMISVNPRSLSFKNLKLSVPSPSPMTITVTNAGVSPLQILSINVVGDDAAVFSLTPVHDCPAELTNLDDFCTISVTATSDNYDTRRAQLQISSNDPKKPIFVVNLKAKAKPPKIARKPSGLSFGTVPLLSSADKLLTITNNGVTDLDIGAITLAGDHPGDFSPLAADTCSGSTLITDGTCAVTVSFTPSVAGKRKAILQVPSNDPNPKRSPLIVNLKGTGE
jgi:hypothetical protein